MEVYLAILKWGKVLNDYVYLVFVKTINNKPVLSSLLDAFKPFRGLNEFNYKSVQVDFILICYSHPINMYLCTASFMVKCSIFSMFCNELFNIS